MSESDDVEVVRCSGNVFRDLHLPDADTEQMKSALATEIPGPSRLDSFRGTWSYMLSGQQGESTLAVGEPRVAGLG